MFHSRQRPLAVPGRKPVAKLGKVSGLAMLVASSANLLAAERGPLPQSFNEQWCVYQTSHYALITDLPHRQAVRMIGGLNRFRQMFLDIFPAIYGDASIPLKMLVFRRDRDFAELTGTTRYAGVTLPSTREYRLLVARSQRGASTDNAWHEYAHYLLRNRTGPNHPLWYEEGLASYLGAANLAADPVRLGKLPRRQMLAVVKDPSVTFQETIEATSVLDLNRAELVVFYRKAWLMIHFIRLGHKAGYPDMRPALARYLDSYPRNFEAAFGQSPQEIGALLADYLATRRLPMETLELPETRTPESGRICLAAEERDYELAVAIVPLNSQVAVRALENLEPTARHLTGLSLAVLDDEDRVRTLVDRALMLEPDHPEANVQRAHLLVRGCEFSSHSDCIGKWARAVRIYLGVLAQDPTRLDAAYGLGVAYLHTGRAPEAMDYLLPAYEKMPWAVPVNYFLGEGYRIAGDRRAAAHLQNARNWARSETWRQRAEFALQRLRLEE